MAHARLARGSELPDQRLQLAALIPHHRLVQATHVPEAGQIRQCGDVGRHLQQIDFLRACKVGREPYVGGRARAAVGPAEAAHLAVGVALGIDVGGIGVTQANRGDPQLVQREQLVGLGHTVLAQIAPHAQLRPQHVVGIEHAVAVGVVPGQRHKPVGRLLPVGEHGMVAE